MLLNAPSCNYSICGRKHDRNIHNMQMHEEVVCVGAVEQMEAACASWSVHLFYWCIFFSVFVFASISCTHFPDLFVSDTQTHTFYTPLLFSHPAPISLICSRNIIMFLPLINHGDREGPHYTWVQKFPTFFFLLHLFITPRLVCTLFSACLAPSGIDTWLLISTGEHQQQPCPPGVFF